MRVLTFLFVFLLRAHSQKHAPLKTKTVRLRTLSTREVHFPLLNCWSESLGPIFHIKGGAGFWCRGWQSLPSWPPQNKLWTCSLGNWDFPWPLPGFWPWFGAGKPRSAQTPRSPGSEARGRLTGNVWRTRSFQKNEAELPGSCQSLRGTLMTCTNTWVSRALTQGTESWVASFLLTENFKAKKNRDTLSEDRSVSAPNNILRATIRKPLWTDLTAVLLPQEAEVSVTQKYSSNENFNEITW